MAKATPVPINAPFRKQSFVMRATLRTLPKPRISVRLLAGQMQDRTDLLLTEKGLGLIHQICGMARTLQVATNRSRESVNERDVGEV